MTHLHRGAFDAGLIGAGLFEVGIGARASQRVAVDRQRMQQNLGVSTVELGALQVLGRVADQSPVAMWRARGALTAALVHEPLLASGSGPIPAPRRYRMHGEATPSHGLSP